MKGWASSKTGCDRGPESVGRRLEEFKLGFILVGLSQLRHIVRLERCESGYNRSNLPYGCCLVNPDRRFESYPLRQLLPG